MKIVVIGSGNLATHLSKALKASENEIVQVYSRTLENAKMLAGQVGAEPIDKIESVLCSADLYIFSVKDDALPEIIHRMPQTTGVWAHTAGSVSMSLFAPRIEKYGVIYPLQTFSKARNVTFSDIPLFIEGNTPGVAHLLGNLAKSISGKVSYLSGDKRCYLHLAAVFACNFANHMYTLASEIIGNQHIPFDVLKPLIAETAAKVMEMDPEAAQTGPAVRFDEGVMQHHLKLIDDTQIKEIYSLLSKSIHTHSI
jgi:Uncharacterized conserved protein